MFSIFVAGGHSPGPLEGCDLCVPRSWGRIAAVSLVLAGAIQFAKLFVASRNCEAFDVVIDACAVLLAWALSITPFHRRVPGSRPVLPERIHLIDALDRRWLLAGWIGVLLLLNWLPFDFRADAGWRSRPAGRLVAGSFCRLPGSRAVPGIRPGAASAAAVRAAGVLLASLGPNRLRPLPFVILVTATLAVLIEIGQAFLPDRFPSVTDVLLETSGAWAGACSTATLAG